MRADQVASFGEQLRQARESQNISLQEIAASTKISSRALQALESEHFDQLPGGIFNKGFVRAYARYVGLDEEKMLEAYMAAAKQDASENDLQTISNQVAAQRPRAESSLNPNALIGLLALVVALGLTAVWFREHRREEREQAHQAIHAPVEQPTQPQPKTVQPSAPQPNAKQPTPVPPGTPPTPATNGAAANPAPAANATPKPATTPVRNQAGAVEVSVTATQKTWISVRSDGKMIDSLLLDPEKPNLRSRTYKAKDKLRMVVGNAGGIDVTSNGKPVAALGKPGQTAVVTFTAEGIEKRQSGAE
jgi:cytoskeleton protein RodZ